MELRRRKHEHQHPDVRKHHVELVKNQDGRKRSVVHAPAAAVKEEEEDNESGSEPTAMKWSCSASDYEAKEEEILASSETSFRRIDSNQDKVFGKKRKADVLQEDSPVEARENQEITMQGGQDVSWKRRRGRRVNIRCEPKKICEVVKLLNAPQREKLSKLGFGCLLDFNMDSIGSRDLIVWLMDHLDPDTLVLDFGGNKKLEITEHAVGCVLGLQRGDLDPPLVMEKLSLLPLRKKLGVPDANKYFDLTCLIQKIQSGGTDRFTMQCFMMIVLAKLLACSSDYYITQHVWSMVQDIDNFANMDWCKFTVDYLRYSAAMWKKPGSKKKTVYACSAFLVMYYLDNLNCKQKMSLVETPRAKFFAKGVIEKLEKADMLRNEDGSPIFGNLNLRIQRHTCYDERTESSRHVPTNMHVPDMSDIAGFPKPHNQHQQLDSQQTEEEGRQEDKDALVGDDEQQTPVHLSSEFVNKQTKGGTVATAQGPIPAQEAPAEVHMEPSVPDVCKEHGNSPVPVHSTSGAAAEAVQQATTFVNEQMKDFMAGSSEPEILEGRLSRIVSLLAQMRALVASETRNSELEQQVKDLTEKLCNTEEELDAARATMGGAQATINSLALRVSATFVRLGDTRPVPPPDVANGSLEEAVKLLEDRVSLIDPVSRGHAASLARSSVAFGAAALLCREKKGAEGLRDAVATDTRRFLRSQGLDFGLLVSRVVDAVEQQHGYAP